MCVVRAGAFDLVIGKTSAPAWALRALRRASWRSALSVFVSVDGEAIGALLLADEIRRGEMPAQTLGLAPAARTARIRP